MQEQLKAIHDGVQALKSSMLDEAKVKEIVQAMLAAQKQIVARRIEFPVGKGGGFDMHGNLVLSAELQQRAFDMQFAASIMRTSPKALKSWLGFSHDVTEFAKAMDTATSEEGAEWIPTGFAAELVQKLKLELKVAALHPRIRMPSDPYKLPVEGGDATAYLVSESTSDTATKMTASTPGTKNITFDAKKLGVRVLWSGELVEDSVIAALPYVQMKVVRALAEAQEEATINGDDSTTHQDSDVTSSADRRKAWKGYRKMAQSAAKVDLSTFNTTNLRSIRKAMGKYGVDPNKLAWIAGLSVFNKMLGLAEVITVDKYGSNATILTGELAKLDGIPVVVSEFIREDLNASGVYDGVTTTKTVLPLVYRPAFLYGDRRDVRARASEELYMETDQNVFVATQRLDLEPAYVYTSEYIVGLGYNITS